MIKAKQIQSLMHISRWPVNLMLWGLCLFPLPKKIPAPFERSDLFYHGIAYLIVFLCFAIKLEKIGKKTFNVASFLILQGILIEFIQPYVNRFFEWYDILANSLGVILGFLTLLLWERIQRKAQSS